MAPDTTVQDADRHRLAQLAIAAAIARHVVVLWPQLDREDLPRTWPLWSRRMRILLRGYRGQSARLAAAYYDHVRALQPGLPVFVPQPMSVPELSATPAGLLAPAKPVTAGTRPGDASSDLFDQWMDRSLGFAGPGTIDEATARGDSPSESDQKALTRVLGTSTRIVLDGGRDTVLGAVAEDPRAYGWYRMTDGDPCWFCAMLASRGPVYKADSFAFSDPRFHGLGEFKVHNHCGCTLVPVFDRNPSLPSTSKRFEQLWIDTARGKSGREARIAFRRAVEGRTAPAATRPGVPVGVR